MADKSGEPTQNTETDILAAGQVSALAEEQQGQPNAIVDHGWSLMDPDEMRNIMAQFTPMAIKDIETIEKGVENFFLFNKEPHALVGPQSLEHISVKELNILEDRNVFKRFEFLKMNPETGRLDVVPVLIRPASLKGEQVHRVKNACVESSVEAFLAYIEKRDQKSQELEKEGRLGVWVSSRFLQSTQNNLQELNINNKNDLLNLMSRLRNLSVEHYLVTDCKVHEDLMIAMVALMNRSATELASVLITRKELSPQAQNVIQDRAELSLLIELAADFHIIQPPGSLLIEIRQGQIVENKSELEWILELYQQIARHILQSILGSDSPEASIKDSTRNSRNMLNELQKHPSFYQGDNWTGGAVFLQCFERLILQVELIHEVRREYLIRLIVQENLKQLNMRFEPLLFGIENFNHIDKKSDSYLPKQKMYDEVLARMQNMPELFTTNERRQSMATQRVWMIYKSNVAQAFIDGKDRRNFLHLICRENGMANGIYDLLVDVSRPQTPEEFIKLQIALGKAIREWEDATEKERRKLELANMGIWARIILFFKSLFGMTEIENRRPNDALNPSDTSNTENIENADNPARSKKAKNRSGDQRPKEKIISIPNRIQQAIDFVDRNNHGLIWVSEVLYSLNSVKFSETKISDMLYYDKLNRYTEIKSLREVKPLYVQQSNLNSNHWIRGTIDYLENIANVKQEYDLVLRYLRSLGE